MDTGGFRLYAIGDIHGMIDPLREVHDWIARDMGEHPGREARIIHIGDYTDRGPDSRAVIEFLMRADPHWISLLGNHDRMFASYVTRPGWQDPKLYRHKGYHWLHPRLGGAETLKSYGVQMPANDITLDEAADFHDQARAAVPQDHVDWINARPLRVSFGDYLFVHAGVDTSLPLDAQPTEALLWMREGWVDFTGKLDQIVVHGHTVMEQPERYQSRIAIDTGAVFGNELTCLVLDGDEVGILTGHNVRPLPMRS